VEVFSEDFFGENMSRFVAGLVCNSAGERGEAKEGIGKAVGAGELKKAAPAHLSEDGVCLRGEGGFFFVPFGVEGKDARGVGFGIVLSLTGVESTGF